MDETENYQQRLQAIAVRMSFFSIFVSLVLPFHCPPQSALNHLQLSPHVKNNLTAPTLSNVTSVIWVHMICVA